MHATYSLADRYSGRSVSFVPQVRTVRGRPLAIRQTDVRRSAHHPIIGVRRPLSDALTSDGTERPVISHRARRFDHDDRTAADLEREATRMLREAGDLAAHNLAPAPYLKVTTDDMGYVTSVADELTIPGMYHVDTVHKYTRQPQVAPDPVAFRGVARWEPISVRTPVAFSRADDGTLVTHESVAIDLIDTGTPGTELKRYRLRTDLPGRDFHRVGFETVHHTTVTGRSHAHKVARRGKASGKPRADVMAMSDKTVANRWTTATDDQRQHAQSLAATLRNDGTITYRGMTVELVLVPSERVALVADDETRATFTLASFTRRVALDGVAQ